MKEELIYLPNLCCLITRRSFFHLANGAARIVWKTVSSDCIFGAQVTADDDDDDRTDVGNLYHF